MSVRTLVISVDCVNADLLDRATRSGGLPALSALRSGGTFARTRGFGLSAEGDWLSFYSGCQPAEHGHISYDEIIPGSYRSRLTSGARTTSKPFYQTISERGDRVVVLNPVHLNVTPVANGCVVTNFQGHDAGHYLPPRSFPSQLANELHRRFPDDPVDPNDWGHSKYAEPARLIAGMRETLRRKVSVFRKLLAEGDWTLGYLGLDECHEMSHLFWHLHDRGHPQHAAAAGDGFDPIVEMLTDIDAAVGELLENVPDDCLVVVVSIAGIAGNYHWSHLVDQLLMQFDGERGGSPARYSEIRSAWNRLPHPVQRSLHAVRHHSREFLLERSRRRRRAFAMPLNEVSGAVRINLAGREPQGVVAAQEFDVVCDELKHKFESLRCAWTAEPLVRAVVKARDNQTGPYVDRMPDLLIEWNTDRPIECVRSPYIGEIKRTFSDARTGHHINEGVVMFSGPDEAPRSLTRPVHIADVGRALVARHRGDDAFGASLF